jgi:hypothetical protein
MTSVLTKARVVFDIWLENRIWHSKIAHSRLKGSFWINHLDFWATVVLRGLPENGINCELWKFGSYHTPIPETRTGGAVQISQDGKSR